MQKIKVCHLYSGNRFGGLEKLLVNIKDFDYFDSNVEHVFFLTFEGKLADELRKRKSKLQVARVDKLSNVFQVFSFWLKFFRFLKAEKIDLVVSHEVWCYILGFLPSMLAQTKQVIWSHTAFFSISLYKFLNYVTPFFVISSSLHVQKLMEKRWGFSRIRTLYCPNHLFEVIENKRSSEKVKVLYVGRFAEYKGLEILIRAASRLKDLNYEINIVGEVQSEAEQEFMNRIHGLIQELGLKSFINFLGTSDNVEEHYHRSDIFCHPNTGAEAFGLVFIEALSAGLPVIATDIGGAKEIFSRAKQSIGELVPPKDPEALAVALRKFIENPRLTKEVSEHAHEVAKSFCDPKVAMKEMNDTFISLVKKSN